MTRSDLEMTTIDDIERRMYQDKIKTFITSSTEELKRFPKDCNFIRRDIIHDLVSFLKDHKLRSDDAEVCKYLKDVIDEELILTTLAIPSVSLNAYGPYLPDVRSKTVYIDNDTMIKLGVTVNDIVEIESNTMRTVANVLPLHPEDHGKNIIRIDNTVLTSMSTSCYPDVIPRKDVIDLESHESVIVRKAEKATPLKKLAIIPCHPTQASVGHDYLSKKCQGMPLYVTDKCITIPISYKTKMTSGSFFSDKSGKGMLVFWIYYYCGISSNGIYMITKDTLFEVTSKCR